MKATSALVVVAVTLILASILCLAGGLIERGIVRVERNIAIGNYAEADATLQWAERLLEYGKRVPWIGDGPVTHVRARRASIRYWQQDYAALVARPTPRPFTPSNEELDLVAANAVYRAGQARAADRPAILQALDAGIKAYAVVLKRRDEAKASYYRSIASRAVVVRNFSFVVAQPDEARALYDPSRNAAFNYEYLLRLRAGVETRRRGELPEPRQDPFGEGGSPLIENESEMGEFRTYIPLESEERKRGAEAGKTAPKAKKG